MFKQFTTNPTVPNTGCETPESRCCILLLYPQGPTHWLASSRHSVREGWIEQSLPDQQKETSWGPPGDQTPSNRICLNYFTQSLYHLLNEHQLSFADEKNRDSMESTSGEGRIETQIQVTEKRILPPNIHCHLKMLWFHGALHPPRYSSLQKHLGIYVIWNVK